MDWFKIEKECDKAVYWHPAYLTYMQSFWSANPLPQNRTLKELIKLKWGG